MADHVGACAAVLTPLYELIKAHVFAAARIQGKVARTYQAKV
jgi:transposase